MPPIKRNDRNNSDSGLPGSYSEQDNAERRRKRQIVLIWEFTQAVIAFLITVAVIYMSANGIESREIKDAFFLVVAMYFMKNKGNGNGEKSSLHA